jgi:hypothetical protein
VIIPDAGMPISGGPARDRSGGPDRVLVSGVVASAYRIAWSHDGRHVFFISKNRELWRVPAAGGEATGGAPSAEVWL